MSGKEIALSQYKQHKTIHKTLYQPMRPAWPAPASSFNLTSISATLFHRFFLAFFLFGFFFGSPEKFLAQLYAYGNEF